MIVVAANKNQRKGGFLRKIFRLKKAKSQTAALPETPAVNEDVVTGLGALNASNQERLSHTTVDYYIDDSTCASALNMLTSIKGLDNDEDLVSMLPGGAATFQCDYNQDKEPVFVDPETKVIEQPNTSTPSIPIDKETCDPELRKKVELVEDYWKCMNAHNPELLRNVCSEDYEVVFMGPDKTVNVAMTLNDIIEEVGKIFISFPDFKFMFRSIEESAAQQGVLVVHDFVATGTHTGGPFALGPFEPIDSTGKFVLLDAQEHHYYFEDGKIVKEEVVPMGEMTGPMGIYIQIGGFPLL